MVNLVQEVCKKLVIHQVKGIVRCFPQQNESENDKQVKIGTEGCNLRGIWDYQSLIDIDKIYTNDISAILNTYGVEAARESITSEIASVFGVYGINVDKRHLSLIGDYMTFEGGYKPFNRIGMDSHTSPFAQMSYERTTHFLTQATVNGGEDLLDNPSARIVMGKVVGGGTGAFDVLQPLV
jgi:DNA-directed RNA polymerase I subunit RPA1